MLRFNMSEAKERAGFVILGVAGSLILTVVIIVLVMRGCGL